MIATRISYDLMYDFVIIQWDLIQPEIKPNQTEIK